MSNGEMYKNDHVGVSTDMMIDYNKNKQSNMLQQQQQMESEILHNYMQSKMASGIPTNQVLQYELFDSYITPD